MWRSRQFFVVVVVVVVVVGWTVKLILSCYTQVAVAAIDLACRGVQK